MLVMNDRTQGGSGFRKGHIELMFNRRVSSHDELGMPEALDEIDVDRGPLRTHHLYRVKFSSDRKELFSTIVRQTARAMNPVQVFAASGYEVYEK